MKLVNYLVLNFQTMLRMVARSGIIGESSPILLEIALKFWNKLWRINLNIHDLPYLLYQNLSSLIHCFNPESDVNFDQRKFLLRKQNMVLFPKQLLFFFQELQIWVSRKSIWKIDLERNQFVNSFCLIVGKRSKLVP